MNIFVSNLDRSITSGDLRRAFAGYGTVINAIVMHDTATGRPLGHAHVYLVPENAAREAIAELQFARCAAVPSRCASASTAPSGTGACARWRASGSSAAARRTGAETGCRASRAPPLTARRQPIARSTVQ